MPMTPPNERRGAHADAATSQDEQTSYLLRMQERLAELNTEARSIRAQLPGEYEQDVETYSRPIEKALLELLQTNRDFAQQLTLAVHHRHPVDALAGKEVGYLHHGRLFPHGDRRGGHDVPGPLGQADRPQYR